VEEPAVATAVAIGRVQGTELVAGTTLLESGLPVVVVLARVIDLAMPETAVGQIELAVVTWAVGVEAVSEVVPDTAATASAPAAAEALPAWAVRAGAIPEVAVEVSAAAAAEAPVAAVVVEEVVGGSVTTHRSRNQPAYRVTRRPG
jgi:hypothetical protein